jgi:uncharacterized protein YdhG (YjbR/CyaY superfamily)
MQRKVSGVLQIYRKAPSPQRETMLAMRKAILEIVPKAEEVISYGMPAFKVDGNVVAGLLCNKNHVGYYPFSGSVIKLFPKELRKYKTTKSALHVPVDKPLPKTLLKKLIKARISQCPIKQGKINLKKYESKDLVWRNLGLAAPARRGLVDNKILKVSDLKRYNDQQLAAIHGIGSNALAILKKTKRKVNGNNEI